jgi:hypothetical protein
MRNSTHLQSATRLGNGLPLLSPCQQASSLCTWTQNLHIYCDCRLSKLDLLFASIGSLWAEVALSRLEVDISARLSHWKAVGLAVEVGREVPGYHFSCRRTVRMWKRLADADVRRDFTDVECPAKSPCVICKSARFRLHHDESLVLVIGSCAMRLHLISRRL